MWVQTAKYVCFIDFIKMLLLIVESDVYGVVINTYFIKNYVLVF